MRKYGKLRERIKANFVNMGEFAKAIGISRSTLSFKLNGKVCWKQSEIEVICKLLDIQMDDMCEYCFYE